MKQDKQSLPPPQRRKHHFNIMIDEVLPRNCQMDIWEAISSVSPSQFLVSQQDILNILLSDHRLFQSFFKRFYLNHLQLYNWYMLARENQLEIKKYVFVQLLDKTYRSYRQAISDQQIRKKFAKMNEVFRDDKKEGKEGRQGKGGTKEGREKKKECFHKTPVGNYRIDKLGFSLCDQEKERRKEEEFQSTLEEFSREDYHQLFLKTFNACDGSKYIYYDFDKHMRGMDQVKNYNTFIRIGNHSRMHNSLTFKPEQQEFPKPQGKENSQSTYTAHPPSTYFHEQQEKLEKMVYCNYNWSAVGSVQTGTHGRDQYIIKRIPNVFKKVRPTNSQSTKAFLLRKKKVL